MDSSHFHTGFNSHLTPVHFQRTEVNKTEQAEQSDRENLITSPYHVMVKSYRLYLVLYCLPRVYSDDTGMRSTTL